MYIDSLRFHKKNYSGFSIGDDDVGKAELATPYLCRTNQTQVENIWGTPHVEPNVYLLSP